MQSYYVPIVDIILRKLESNKSDVFNNRFVRLYHFISANTEHGLGADFFIKVIDQIQAKLASPIKMCFFKRMC